MNEVCCHSYVAGWLRQIIMIVATHFISGCYLSKAWLTVYVGYFLGGNCPPTHCNYIRV